MDDITFMPDLSNVLGQVYAHLDEQAIPPAVAPAPLQPAPAGGPTTPEWADDAHLEQAFANWSPGTPPEASAAERRFAANLPAHREPAAPHVPIDAPARPVDDELAAALNAAVAAAPDHPVDNDHPADNQASPDPGAVPAPVAAPAYGPGPESTPTVYPPLSAPPVAAPPVAATPLPATPVPVGPQPKDDYAFAWIDPQVPVEAPIEGVGARPDGPAAEAPVAYRPWQRTDDDILPSKGGRARKSRNAVPGARPEPMIASAMVPMIAPATVPAAASATVPMAAS
ncbi:MAG TPA: hypothetical protein VF954_08395, partial [Acidimicrobiales bacterium]